MVEWFVQFDVKPLNGEPFTKEFPLTGCVDEDSARKVAVPIIRDCNENVSRLLGIIRQIWIVQKKPLL